MPLNVVLLVVSVVERKERGDLKEHELRGI